MEVIYYLKVNIGVVMIVRTVEPQIGLDGLDIVGLVVELGIDGKMIVVINGWLVVVLILQLRL